MRACGKPTKSEDRTRNVTWAIRVLARYKVAGNAEWSTLVSQVHAEVRGLGMEVAAEDQVHLCQALASVQAVDELAAAAYDQLATTAENQVSPVHAWLFARAASVTGYKGKSDLKLFARTFADPDLGPGILRPHEMGFRPRRVRLPSAGAALVPGSFPEALGAAYPPRGEQFLLQRRGVSNRRVRRTTPSPVPRC